MDDGRSVRRQARGLKRMEAILDAAEEVIAEVGYADATTNAIAARASISPGSLYQFFRNKDEILEGLLTRFTELEEAIWEAQLGPDAAVVPAAELVDRVIDTLATFKAQRPAFAALLHGSATPDRLATAAEELHRGISQRLDGLLARRAPHLSPRRRARVADVMIATARAVMPMAASADATGAREILRELKEMLAGYLETAAEPAAGPAAGSRR